MKNNILRETICCMMFCTAVFSAAAQDNPARLLVRADDMGSFHSANIACIEAATKGIARSVEVMVVAPWFPEAVKMLNENPGIDVGLHLTFTSEWENMKWRPLTDCPGITDENGYFYPMMSHNDAYPGKAIKENKWLLDEIVQEARAQIEMALDNLPQLSHISGHMGAYTFSPEVKKAIEELAAEYDLTLIDKERYGFKSAGGYHGPHKTYKEKEQSFLKMIETLEAGETYIFVDHPSYDNVEMESVGHIGYEDVAFDRQGVTDLFTSPEIKTALDKKNIELVSYNEISKGLQRAEPSFKLKRGVEGFVKDMEKMEGDELHSLMILQHGKVLSESWHNGWNKDMRHTLFSATKTFTATAVGFAVDEGKLNVTDKVISFFPDKLPQQISPELQKLEVRHLLTMSTGFDKNPGKDIALRDSNDLVRGFLATPIEHEPGTFFCYSSMNSYMLSAIVQKVTGEKLYDYLYPRLFRPLGITGLVWRESNQGINQGGWGLNITTEDMAKFGLFLLNGGKWNDRQLLSSSWIEEATSSKIASHPAGSEWDKKIKKKDSDWMQGYCYQMWRCRNNGVRADGANGQFIIILPEKDAVIAITSNVKDMQAEINLVWKHIFPVL